jgi:hypothetical protein
MWQNKRPKIVIRCHVKFNKKRIGRLTVKNKQEYKNSDQKMSRYFLSIRSP